MEYSEKVKAELKITHETAVANKIIDMMQRLKLSNDDTTACRWIWELIQNAKDVVNDSGKINIKVNLDKQNKKLIFQHNGKYFTTSNIVNLISQVSSKDRENQQERKQTGKFGTGFLTTHLLSEQVVVVGLLQDPDDSIKKINILLDRSGSSKTEIIESLKKSYAQLENSKDVGRDYKEDISEYNTKFIYQLDDEGIKIAQNGLKSLEISAPYIFAFLDEINCMVINDTLKFSRYKVLKSKSEKYSINYIQCSNEEKVYDYLIFMVQNNNVRIAVPVNYINKEIIFMPYEKGTPKLFCDFPLIGTENFDFPVVVNSTSFNPTEPRDGIYLTDKENPIVNENKNLMLQALEAYKELLDYAEKYKCKQCYNIVTFGKQLDKYWLSIKWLKNNIINECKEYIKTSNIIDTEAGDRKALFHYWTNESQLLIIGDTDKELRENVWKLSQHIFKNKLIKFDEIHEWYNSLWVSCRNFNILYLIDNLEYYGDLDTLSEVLDDNISVEKWLNELYKIIMKFIPQNDYKEFRIFPNQMGEFCTIDELYYDIGIEEEYKKILMLLGKECKEILLDDRISIQDMMDLPQYSYENMFDAINEALEDNEEDEDYRSALGELIVLYDDNEDNKKEQDDLIDMLDSIFEDELPDYCKVTTISSSIMKKAEKYWCNLISNIISKCENLSELKKIIIVPKQCSVNNWISNFIDYLVKYKHQNLLDRKIRPILPNQNGIFKTQESLFLDSGEIDELFKDILLNDGIDIRDNLLLKDIYLPLPDNRTKGLKDIANNIIEYVKKNQGIIKNSDEIIKNDFKNLYLWINENEEKAKRYFGELIEKKHWLYNDNEIANNIRKAEAYDDILRKYSISNTHELEKILEKNKGEIELKSIEKEVTEEALVACGISNEQDFSEAVDMNVFTNNFVHNSESNIEKFKYVEKLLERAKNKIFEYLRGKEEYELRDITQISNTIFSVRKCGEEIYLITRPSDYGEVILYYDLEKDVLDYERDWELWVEDGKSDPERITFGKMMKLTGINKIPLRKVK